MKFTIKKDLLLDALSKVSKAISTKNLIPVLAGIKFELKKKKLTLTASDNDITIQTTIESVNDDEFKIDSEGSIIIQGKYILDIVRKLPDQYINVEVIDENMNSTSTVLKKNTTMNPYFVIPRGGADIIATADGQSGTLKIKYMKELL